MTSQPASQLPASADVVIIGGAAIGSSIACHIAADPAFTGRVVVIEKDPTYQFSASALSAASIRQQYSSAVNIRISLYGIQFLREIGERLAVGGDRPEIGLTEGGYLYVAGPEGAPVLEENNALQRAEGADILLLDPEALRARYPWLNTEDLSCGTWGRSGEGWFDGWGLMQAFRKKARSLGVIYAEGQAAAIERDGARISAVRLADGSRIACGAVVNAAGASGGRQVAALAGVDIPVHSKKRFVFSFTCKAEIHDAPLLIDPSGAWFRPEGRRGPEGQLFIGSAGPTAEMDDPDSDEFDVDWGFFDDFIWPALATRVPAFEQIRPGRAWAGHYDMNLFDHNAILGKAGGLENFYLANGFSGHGLQQSPAVGRGLAELILHGRYLSLDLSEMSFERIAANRPLLERNVI
ncbi:NAD(P)/FAD-dependent oxidoreductase [Alsobacter metallidurans]|uniref:NAD(P)/FAD-dependent oxidoreductase n=1 Tax=Alsobacter metallidurans TaxID=340221 RepID=UPI0016641F4E|nr:FAD-binding oxidoreductase [Alsobacter metallidurans]